MGSQESSSSHTSRPEGRARKSIDAVVYHDVHGRRGISLDANYCRIALSRSVEPDDRAIFDWSLRIMLRRALGLRHQELASNGQSE